jgi:predicted ArsR family transcriptional regulator
MMKDAAQVHDAEIELERDFFLRVMLRELSGTLQDVVGMAEASGYVSIVGSAIGDRIDADYRRALAVDRLTRDQVLDVLVDLKRRIQGDFFILEEHEDRIVLGNRVCPFGNMVEGRPSLCMMTSNVFGAITAQNLGYARVEIEEAIALGHAGCRIVVHLVPENSPAGNAREYFRIEE